MKTVLVTGAYGFVGKNLCSQLEQNKDLRVLRFGSKDTLKKLGQYIREAEFIFHLAGVNRPKDSAEFDKGNRVLTEHLLTLLEENKKNTPLLLSSSIQADLDNPYGDSKRAAEEAMLAWAKRTNNSAYIYRLPNLFGKWCKPNYNSVVATFCNNIASGEPITINDPTISLALAYIDDVVGNFIAALEGEVVSNKDGFCEISKTFEITLGELGSIITSFKRSRDSLIMPSMESDLLRDLYATYTSYLPRNEFEYKLHTNRDDRGWLAEFIKSRQFGQIFVSSTKPGIARGNHWHHTKVEKFLVVGGKGKISFRNKVDDQRVIEYDVSGADLTVVDIPTGYVHAITNVGETDLVTIFWASEMLDQERPDTYYENV